MSFYRRLGVLKRFFMSSIHRSLGSHRLGAFLCCMVFALLTACNPAPLSVIASDFSINGVKGTGAGLYTADSVKNVTIDLTSTETCSNLTSLVTKVTLKDGATISPDPGLARDYTSPIAYVVTDSYGTKLDYLVTVKGTACATTKTTTSTTPTCTLASVGSTGYSLVFKACDSNNVATYYDKTECVRDNATGLIWEGKTSSGLRSVDNKYNNLDSTSLLQIAANTVPGTTALPARSPTQAEIDAPDNSIGYKNNVNALGLCGSTNRRLPTLTELQTIRLAATTTQIDMDWFAATNFDGYYATSTQFGAQVERSYVIQFYDKGAAAVDNLLRDGTVWHPTFSVPLALREHSVRLVRSAF